MNIEFTVKIKDEHNPPEFLAGLSAGVIAKEFIVFESENISEIQIANKIIELQNKLLKKYFEVTCKEIKTICLNK